MAEFYTLLTQTGAARLTNAQAFGTTVDLTELALGDADGVPALPVEIQTALVNEVWRGPITSITQDNDNPDWLVMEAVIPAAVGGWTVREIGLFDDQGNLIAVGNFPETYKPNLTEGSSRDMQIRMIIQTGNAATVELTVDPSVVVATQQYVNNRLADLGREHHSKSARFFIAQGGGDVQRRIARALAVFGAANNKPATQFFKTQQ